MAAALKNCNYLRAEIVEKQTTGIDEKGKTLIQSNQTTLEIS
ncbi:hypothetical protein BECAL_02736, partial [Bellilinea caldifistulae]